MFDVVEESRLYTLKSNLFPLLHFSNHRDIKLSSNVNMAVLRESWQYRKIMSSLDEPESQQEHQKPQGTSKLFTASTLCLTLLVVIGIVSVRLWPRSPWSPAHSTPARLHCGNSTAEAISRGCTFDPVTVTWLPKECPRDVVDEFLESSNAQRYRYWFDLKGEHEIIGYDNLSMTHDHFYYTTQREHAAHCAFVMLRSYHVMRRGDRVDQMSDDPHHWHHCLMYLLDMDHTQNDIINTKGRIGFQGCKYHEPDFSQ
jgi:hypothetical protein